MANTVKSSERNTIDNAAYEMLGKPVKEAAKALMQMFGISKDRAEGAVSRAARKQRERDRRS
jgi:hypothetical protein